MAYSLFEHTADIGIHAIGSDLAEALSEAGRGLAEVVTGRPQTPGPRVQAVEFAIEAPDEPALIVAFLAELLWILESEDQLWLTGGGTIGPTPDGLRFTVSGNARRWDASAHGRGTEVKAITYHDLRVDRTARGVEVRVILDI